MKNYLFYLRSAQNRMGLFPFLRSAQNRVGLWPTWWLQRKSRWPVHSGQRDCQQNCANCDVKCFVENLLKYHTNKKPEKQVTLSLSERLPKNCVNYNVKCFVENLLRYHTNKKQEKQVTIVNVRDIANKAVNWECDTNDN